MITAGAIEDAYQRGRTDGGAEERAKNVALLRELADKAAKVADKHIAAGRSEDLTHSACAEAFETAAFAIEAGEGKP